MNLPLGLGSGIATAARTAAAATLVACSSSSPSASSPGLDAGFDSGATPQTPDSAADIATVDAGTDGIAGNDAASNPDSPATPDAQGDAAGPPVINHVLGAATTYFGNGTTSAYVMEVGAQPHVMGMYWPLLQDPYPATTGSSFPCNVLQADQPAGIVLMTLIPGDNNAGGPMNEPTNLEITNGTFDAALTGWATGIKACGIPLLLRFAHEMNGNWYAWSPGVNGNPADGSGFIAMWKHVWTLFRQNGVDSSLVRWVFCPNVSGPSTPTPIASVYPGAGYVDILALDGYNWGTTQGGQWQTFTQVFSDSYEALSSLPASSALPMMVGETGASTSNGDSAKAAWITSALGTEIPTVFPRIQTVVYFDIDYGGESWAFDSGPASLAAFSAQAQSAFWNNSFQW
jgi:hypothetical protein